MIYPPFYNAPRPIYLKSNQLTVAIDKPGSFYRGTRFDWTGFVLQVTLTTQDGLSHTFCAPEALEEGVGSNGFGLCNEFGIDTAIGYSEARPGEVFPKLGIGLLVRDDDQPYSFFKNYTLAQRFLVDICQDDSYVIFTSAPFNCRGYSAKLQKTLRVRNNELLIDYNLENTGSKPLITEEYCHNFMAIDFDPETNTARQPIGPEYVLRFPYPVEYEKPSPAMRKALPAWKQRLLPTALQDRQISGYAKKTSAVLSLDGYEISFRTHPLEQFYCRLSGYSQIPTPQFELFHRSTGLGMNETDSFPPSRIAVWGSSHVVSAEVFQKIELQPDEFLSWSRRYSFFSGEAS